MKELCAYCKINEVGNSEHVFPMSLGGENIYLDCVCDACNNKFSNLERELIQKSPVALMRSEAGLEGYRKNKVKPAPLKGSTIIFHDENENILYEIGQHKGFQTYLRPQILYINNELYFEGSENNDFENFTKALKKWLINKTIVLEFPTELYKSYKIAKLLKNDHGVECNEISVKRVKNHIVFCSFKQTDPLFEHLTPRLFLDDDMSLILRAKSFSEGMILINKLFNYIDNKQTFGSYSKNFPISPVINVHMNFDMRKTERALVKIGINIIMKYFSDFKNHKALENLKLFVLHSCEYPGTIGKRIELVDNNLHSHNVLFTQMDRGVIVRVSLFKGNFVYNYFIPDILIQHIGITSGVFVKYLEKKQIFYPNIVSALGHN